MVMSPDRLDREKQKFSEINNKPVVDVNQLGGLGLSPYDSVVATYPNETTEIYTYSLNAVTTNTVTIIYTDSCKTDLNSVTRS